MRTLNTFLHCVTVGLLFLGGEYLHAQATDAASDRVVVVGNRAQPVQWNHRDSIKDAILLAQPNGTVVIPSSYAGTDCNPVATCNPGSVQVIDWRPGGSGGISVPVPVNFGGTGTINPCGGGISFMIFNGSTIVCDSNASDDGNAHVGFNTVSTNALTVNGTGAGVMTAATGTGVGAPVAGKAVYYVDSGTGLFTCLLPGSVSCMPSAGGGGTVSTSGSPASGNLAKFSGAAIVTNADLSGDCTTSGTAAVTCTKTNGLAFVASATSDATNASNIVSGTLPAGRLPATAVQTNQSNTYSAGTQDLSGAAHTLPALKGTTAGKPATCTQGEQYFATDATAGQNLFFCTATNTWTQQLNTGGGTITANYYASPWGGTTSLGFPTINTTKIYSVTFPNSISGATKLSYRVNTSDNSGNLYDIGLYDNGGNLVCHTGATAGTSIFPSTSDHNIAWASACSVTAGLRYYWALTGNATTAILAGQSQIMSPSCNVNPATNSSTSGGALNGTITYPADSISSCVMPNFGLMP